MESREKRVQSVLAEHRYSILLISFIVIGYSLLILFTGTLSPVIVVRSNSMFPILARGDLVFVKSASITNLDVGSIIVFEPPKPYDPSLTIHRVIKKWVEGDTVFFNTKGDNNATPDTYRIPASNIRAEYTGIKIPLLGYVIFFIQSPLGTVSFISVFGIWIVYIYLIKNDSSQ
jgi:signal peptidase